MELHVTALPAIKPPDKSRVASGNPARQAGTLYLPNPEGWKAELTYVI